MLYKAYSISPGSGYFKQDNVLLGPMPKRVIIGLLENASINGQYDPFHFDYHKVKFLTVYVDG